MKEIAFHFITGKKMVFSLTDEENSYLEHCLDGDVRWFRLSDQALDLHRVVFVESV